MISLQLLSSISRTFIAKTTVEDLPFVLLCLVRNSTCFARKHLSSCPSVHTYMTVNLQSVSTLKAKLLLLHAMDKFMLMSIIAAV